MRYILKNNRLSPVEYVKTEGRTVSNPPDELVDQLGAGGGHPQGVEGGGNSHSPPLFRRTPRRIGSRERGLTNRH